MRPKLGRLFDQAYSDARRIAAAETGLPILTFPVDPPFDLDQVQDENFFPYHERDGV